MMVEAAVGSGEEARLVSARSDSKTGSRSRGPSVDEGEKVVEAGLRR